MSTPFLAEIRMFSFNYAPKGWADCDGRLLPINQNQPLFSLLGTTYGGDGRVNFALPNLHGRVPIHQTSDYILGQRGGELAHTLTISEMPQHNHTLQAVNVDGNQGPAVNNYFAKSPNQLYHAPDNNLTPLNPNSVTMVGGSQAHLNLMPSLGMFFGIALTGIFPSKN
jgi:microcystin-dependent protein